MDALSRLLGLPSAEAVLKYISRYGIPHLKVGKRTFVLLDSLLTWMKAREVIEEASQLTNRTSTATLAGASSTVRRRSRVDLTRAAARLVGRVAESNPK